jgi:hypothetical protein
VSHEDFAEADGLVVDSELTLPRLKAFIESPQPLAACRFCLGTSGRSEVQRQLTIQEIRLKRSGKALDSFRTDMLASQH